MRGDRASDAQGGAPRRQLPWPDDAPLFASGTDALAALLRWGAAEHGWSRVWLPSYYCPDVPAALRAFATGLDVLTYGDSDLTAPTDLSVVPAAAGDVVVVANQLGVRRRPSAGGLANRRALLVEDHSHDLGSAWAWDSAADYAVASLRKTLPIPDGGVVWSPAGLALPTEPGASGGTAAAGRLASAIARRAVRPGGDAGERLRLRALARAAATTSAELATADATDRPGSPGRRGISPVSRALVSQMPLVAWRERRRANIDTLVAAIGATRDAKILTAPEGGVAFALTLVFDTPEARARVQRGLTARAVMPAILWPLDPRDPGTGPADADLSRRILSVHADQRFSEADMLALGAIAREALGEA